MKATGIVRRIDELGRIVIPKEIRRTLRIRESDPMEIFTNHEGGIVLKNILRSGNSEIRRRNMWSPWQMWQNVPCVLLTVTAS